ncbi:gastrotropin-like [Mytilus californianus]|uniref:gastrotropin-like n=1 Tax=Mytilus californianus TaxID=6549 RepID=UPI0022460956|nr:gastrotropin-like [Mytilus californianus]
MAQFLGKWIEDGNSIKNYDEFCRAAGIPDDMKDKHRDATSVLEYEQDGDYWILKMSYSGLPTKTFKFQPGKELETTGYFDDVLKLMVTFESDSKCVVVEKNEMMGYKPFTVTREVKGDMMFTTVEISDVKMTSEFKRG